MSVFYIHSILLILGVTVLGLNNPVAKIVQRMATSTCQFIICQLVAYLRSPYI